MVGSGGNALDRVSGPMHTVCIGPLTWFLLRIRGAEC